MCNTQQLFGTELEGLTCPFFNYHALGGRLKLKTH